MRTLVAAVADAGRPLAGLRLVVLSDRGLWLGEDGWLAEAAGVDDPITRVPLIAWDGAAWARRPGGAPDGLTNGPVSLLTAGPLLFDGDLAAAPPAHTASRAKGRHGGVSSAAIWRAEGTRVAWVAGAGTTVSPREPQPHAASAEEEALLERAATRLGGTP